MNHAPHSHPHEIEDHDRGLRFDLTRFVGRRRLLALAATGAGAVVLAACGDDDDASGSTSTSGTSGATDSTGATASTAGDTTAATTGSTTASTTAPTTASTTAATTASTTASTSAASCETIPEETAGPFPGDGSNGPNILSESGVVRSDITASIGSASGVAAGVPLTVELTVTDTAADCAPRAGAAVYLWHCDREGRYSMYSEGAENENYLRGVQETDADGNVTFVSIFPACYSGRWPHIHFEVYASLDEATSAGDPIATSQLAFPEEPCDVVYATEGYEQSVSNLNQLTLESDNIFSDGVDQQVATMSGDASSGYTAVLTVPI